MATGNEPGVNPGEWVPGGKTKGGAKEAAFAETAMYRFKQLLAGKVSLRNYNGQVGEVMAYVSAINKLNTLGLPVRKPRV